jgi:hypothetical protein
MRPDRTPSEIRFPHRYPYLKHRLVRFCVPYQVVCVLLPQIFHILVCLVLS